MKVNYNWLKDYVGETLPDANEVEALLTKHAFEIEGVEKIDEETVIDVDVLPNRSSDCLCHRGIARELATILDTPLHYDPLAAAPTLTELPQQQQININIADTAACPRFTASLITGIEVKESPGWLQERLESLGQRSINNIVDATNYVMFSIGQPLHAYDADLFPQTDGAWQFGVRYATEGEVVEILPEGGNTEPRQIECKGTELLIVDESSNTPIGLAGVKGGQFAGVHAGTKNIIIEAAHFDRTVTRKTARRLGIVIDASKRFENECSRELPPFAQYEIIKLIKDIAGGEYVGTTDQYHEQKPSPAVEVRVAKTNALLGLALSQAEVSGLIARTGSAVEVTDEETLVCTGPWERTDLNIEADYIEEVGRLHGLDNIASIAPAASAPAAINLRQFYSEMIRRVLIEAGCSEVITSSFQKKDKIQLQNALASDKSYVRSTLRKNIASVLDANYTHADLVGMSTVQVFEIGTVFSKSETSVEANASLCIGVRTKGDGYTAKDDKPLLALLDAVAEVLGTTVDWTIEKGVAEVDLDALITTLDTPTAYEPFAKPAEKTFTPISSYPAVSRDIALWVQSGIAAEQVVEVLQTQAGDLCVRLDLFDEFTKDGRTSYAFRLVFLSHKKTLTDSEVNTIMDRINDAAGEREWEVR